MSRLTLLLLAFIAMTWRPSLADDAAKSTPPLAIDASTSAPQVPLPANMKMLFDGKSLDGWTQIPADSWTIRNGILASVGSARGVIYTKQSFGRYRIIFDV